MHITARLGDGILYVGMNGEASQCDAEHGLLASRGGGVRRQVAHGERDPTLGADRVRHEGEVFDLADPHDTRAFATSLGLEAEQTARVVELLAGAPPGGRDELAALAVAFAIAERGGDLPSRLVLSGHCTGTSVWDGAGKLGELRFTDVFALADTMPRAAAQIEDVMLSACSSGLALDEPTLVVSLRAWRAHFPNLKTAWGYGGERDAHSPTGAVALKHLEAWEAATRGRATHVDASAALRRVNDGAPVPYAASVSIWSIARDYVRGR